MVTWRTSCLKPIAKFLIDALNRQKKYVKLISTLRLHSSVVEQGTHKPKVESSNLSGAIPKRSFIIPFHYKAGGREVSTSGFMARKNNQNSGIVMSRDACA
jgi:hypothetical protein